MTGGHGSVLEELRADGLRVVWTQHAPALTLGRHAHDTAKLCLVLEGAATERCGLEVTRQLPLVLFARPPCRAHENQYHALGARSILVEVDATDRGYRALATPPLLDEMTGRKLGTRLVSALAGTRSGRQRRVRRAVLHVAETLEARRGHRTPAWLERVRETLVANLIEPPPPLGELARAAGVHPVHLAQAFRARFGMTTREFLRAHRVFAALELIQAGAGLATAAAATGFADQSHMTRAVHFERGAPPGSLRRQRAQHPNFVQDGL
jgi:AraC family transcriptional regulator